MRTYQGDGRPVLKASHKYCVVQRRRKAASRTNFCPDIVVGFRYIQNLGRFAGANPYESFNKWARVYGSIMEQGEARRFQVRIGIRQNRKSMTKQPWASTFLYFSLRRTISSVGDMGVTEDKGKDNGMNDRNPGRNVHGSVFEGINSRRTPFFSMLPHVDWANQEYI